MESSNSLKIRISVCVCTFRRPQLLASLLSALAAQTHDGRAWDIEVVVADNDPAHSARAVLTDWQARQDLHMQVLHVPVANISLARNATVARASGEWIAFIDDDETPQPDWLLKLLQAQRQFGADAVFAPVVPLYLPSTPAWIVRGNYFDRRRFATGTRIDEKDARTGNVLLRAALLRALPGPFDAYFGRTGGEDSLLFRDLLARGAVFVWCDDAAVTEDVPLERATARWLLRRSFRVGQTWIRAELYRLPQPARSVRAFYLLGRACTQLLVSLALGLLCLLWSPARAFGWMRTAAMQSGKITGLTPLQYLEYGK